jgi:hypothetical protein
MPAEKTVVKCPRCGLEATIDLTLSKRTLKGRISVDSFGVDQTEYRRLCKRAAAPRFKFNCPDFLSAIQSSVRLPSGDSK